MALQECGLWVLHLPISPASSPPSQPSSRGCQNARSFKRHAALVFCTPHHVTGFAQTQLSFLVETMTSKNQPHLSTLDMGLIVPSNKQRAPNKKGDALMDIDWTSKHDSSKRDIDGVDATLSLTLSLNPYAVIHSSKSCLDPQTLI